MGLKMRLEFEARRGDRYKRILARKTFSETIGFSDWQFPVPRIGERVWLSNLELLEDDRDDPEWRVTDVWWEPEAAEDLPECVVFIELQDVLKDTPEDEENVRAMFMKQESQNSP